VDLIRTLQIGRIVEMMEVIVVVDLEGVREILEVDTIKTMETAEMDLKDNMEIIVVASQEIIMMEINKIGINTIITKINLIQTIKAKIIMVFNNSQASILTNMTSFQVNKYNHHFHQRSHPYLPQ